MAQDTLSLVEAKQLVEEAISDRLLDIERSTWTLIKGITDGSETGPTLEEIKSVVPGLREMASTNPWHIRGVNLRNAYVFGRGVNYVNVDKPRHLSIIEDPQNQSALFGVDAYAVANKADFSAGNFFALKKNNKFIVVPIEQISNFSTNPDDASDIWFLKRSWRANGKDDELWYPTDSRKNSGDKLPKSIKLPDGRTEPVASDGVFYVRRSNRQEGWTWGLPSSLGAVVWTQAYAAYLKDNALLVRALSKIAWKITNTTTGGTTASAATVRDSANQVGGIASMAAGNQLQGVGVPSAQVNMGNGQPLIAAAATTFGVPVIALLASPGETGGSYGSAATLDEPTLKVMTEIQSSWADFYRRVLRDLGAKDAFIEFPAIQTDPAYRRITSIALAVETGLVWEDEGRDAIMDIEDIPRLHDGPPPKPVVDTSNNTGSDPIPSQGNTGAVPGGVNQDDTNHDPDNE